MQRFWNFLAGAGFTFVISQGAWASALPVPQLETLPNGMQLAWFLSDRLPIVDLAVLVKSGSADDELGKSGTAELVAATLDRGAGGLNAQQIARSVEMLGASRYANADEDTFSVGMHGLAPDATTLLELLSKMVLKPEFPIAEVTREHSRIADRWSHLADYGDALASHAYKRLISSGTPYGRGSLLSMQEFGKVKQEDVIRFHKKHFVPGNAILMVVGQVNQTEFRNKIISLFGNWSGNLSPKKKHHFSDSRLHRSFGHVYVVNRPNLSQAQVRIGFQAPLIDSPDHYSLVVANALLGEYFNSRLNSLIRDKLALTYSIGSSFTYEKELGYFTVASSTRNEAVGQLIKKTNDVLKELKAGPIALDEIAMAKEYLIGGFPLTTATLGAVAVRWLGGYVFDLGPDYLNEYIPKVQAVTVPQVLNSVGKHFDLNRLVLVVAGDANAITKSLNQSGFHRIKRVEIRDLM